MREVAYLFERFPSFRQAFCYREVAELDRQGTSVQVFAIPYSFTAHANDIFAPRDFVVSLAKLIENAAAVVTVSDFAAQLLRDRFPEGAAQIHRVYNGVDLSRFQPSDFSARPAAIVSIGRW